MNSLASLRLMPKLPAEFLRPHAVQQAEVDGLGLAPLVSRDLGLVEQDLGCAGMDVVARGEGVGSVGSPDMCARTLSSIWE